MSGPVIIVFGITGDLSKRKLLPALYHLLSQDLLPSDTQIIGISRRPLTTEKLLATVELCVLEKDNICDPEGLARVRNALQTLQLDPKNPSDFEALKHLLDKLDQTHKRERLFYMSVPASAYDPIITNLAAHGLNEQRNRLLLEKPFGHNLKSAGQLLKLVDSAYHESQIYRIDHYLAKETAQNVLAFRMHNPIFMPLWNAEHIQCIHIRALEALSIEERADFYDQTGALRDLIQSHLMQLLAITMMDIPADTSSHAIHRSKAMFLEQLLPADPAEAVRGQYDGYKSEVTDAGSHTETYARLQLEHATERWQGTEIILETGKALSEKTTDIVIEFKNPRERRRNNLTFQIQPNEGIGLGLVVKEPGFENHMRHAALEFSYSQVFAEQQIDAYERVLMDALRGDQALFASDREVLATWRVLDPVLEVWNKNDHGLQPYVKGSEGPPQD